MVRFRIILNLQKEPRNLLRKKPAFSDFTIRGKVEEFQISLQNRYSAITEDEVLKVQAINDNGNNIIRECAVEVGGRAARQNTSKFCHETKDLIMKRQNMQSSNTIGKIELAELSKLINMRKANDIRKHNMQTIEHAQIKGGRLNAVKRKLGIGKNEIYGLRDKDRNLITDMDRIVEVVEEFYTNLYSGSNTSDANDAGRGTDELDIPPVTKEVRKVLAVMKGEK